MDPDDLAARITSRSKAVMPVHYAWVAADLGAYSFHYTKNITCGEGGAFLTNNDEIAFQAEMIREKGTNRASFMRGEIDKYSWVMAGSSYVLSDLLAGLLDSQMNSRDSIRQKRQRLHPTTP